MRIYSAAVDNEEYVRYSISNYSFTVYIHDANPEGRLTVILPYENGLTRITAMGRVIDSGFDGRVDDNFHAEYIDGSMRVTFEINFISCFIKVYNDGDRIFGIMLINYGDQLSMVPNFNDVLIERPGNDNDNYKSPSEFNNLLDFRNFFGNFKNSFEALRSDQSKAQQTYNILRQPNCRPDANRNDVIWLFQRLLKEYKIYIPNSFFLLPTVIFTSFMILYIALQEDRSNVVNSTVEDDYSRYRISFIESRRKL
jgi:hypothetical protein